MVDTVTPVSGTTTQTSSTSAASTAATLNYDSFLRLLTAQLEFQDPTNPQDSTEFMSQLASFSTVEQSILTNDKLDSLLTSFSLGQAESVLGRQLTSADGSITGTVASVNIITGGAVAVLESGQEIPLTDGIKIS